MKKRILILIAVMAALAFLPGSVGAGGCDVTVTAGDGSTAIQDAVSTASAGDKICLDGTFTTTSGPSGTSEVDTVTIGTSDITITSASSAVIDGGSGPAFRLADGVSNVTIMGLEIRCRTGSRGGGVEAWDMSTSNITIRNNDIHDNSYNGVLVGSEGGYIHKNWMVRDNTVNDHGFAGIELSNCENCKIMKNQVVGAGFAGIVVQARNTAGILPQVHINGVNVLHNTVDDASAGIYVLSYTGPTGPPFMPAGAAVLLTNVNVNNNTVSNSGSVGVIYWAYNAGAMAKNGRINHNEINCGVAGAKGIRVLQAGAEGTGVVKNVKVANNSFDGSCSPNVEDTGTATKLPPGPGPF